MRRKTSEVPYSSDAVAVGLLGPPSAVAVMVLEIAALVGTQIDCCDDISELSPRAALVIALPDAPFPREGISFPVVRVGAAGEGEASADILLPGQAAALAALLADPLAHVGRGQMEGPGGRRCLVVTGVSGGIGTSTTAAHLARVTGALVLDASGHPPVPFGVFDRDQVFHWGMVDPADPPLPTELLRHLPRVDGVRQLQAMPGESLRASDPKVAAVVSRAPCPVVIDAGIWDRSVDGVLARIAGAGRSPLRSVLISRGDEESAMHLAGVLAASSALGIPQSILGVGKNLEPLRQVGDPYDVPLVPRPRGERQWRSFWQSLWKPAQAE